MDQQSTDAPAVPAEATKAHVVARRVLHRRRTDGLQYEVLAGEPGELETLVARHKHAGDAFAYAVQIKERYEARGIAVGFTSSGI